ncbi:MAG: hypothetical protein JWO76_707 [Nocardioides sp.]|nr:hypothetical protein [Nocardioides sp.]
MADDGRPVPQLPDRVTLPLLTLITQQSLDEDYLHVAERRAAGPPSGSTKRPSHRTAAVVIAVFGILVTTAAVQTSRNAGVEDASRTTLISQIMARRTTVSNMQDRIVRQRERNLALDAQLSQLTRTEQASAARLRRLEVRTGYVAVTGPGVRIVVDDAPEGDATQAVRDEDLAMLVDGLWNAGAEAISINGQRLTVLSAIRNVNVAIHVNSRPVNPPYVVQAIGDPRTLQAKLFETTHGLRFADLARRLGFVFEIENEDSLSLPAARTRQLRYVVVGTAEDNNDKHLDEESTP